MEILDPSQFDAVDYPGGHIEVHHRHGSLIYRHDRQSGKFTIAKIDVDQHARRSGIGKSLLRRSREIALAEGANLVFAAITSRECLEAMTGVFGEEGIYTQHLGEYEQPDPGSEPALHRRTIAQLNLELPINTTPPIQPSNKYN